MRVLRPCCAILESLSQFGIGCPKPRLAFNIAESEKLVFIYNISTRPTLSVMLSEPPLTATPSAK